MVKIMYMVFAFLKYSPIGLGRKSEGGLYNGYVAFDNELFPLDEEKKYSWDDELTNQINIHGGVTFNDYMDSFKKGFIHPLTNLPPTSELFTKKYRVIGFDTMHCDDTAKMWTFERTKEETMEMYQQVIDILKNNIVNKLIMK